MKKYFILRRVLMMFLFVWACYTTFTIITNLTVLDIFLWFTYTSFIK